MATWAGPYSCSDCGKPMEQAGTCNDCIVASQKVGEKIRKDLAKSGKKGRGK